MSIQLSKAVEADANLTTQVRQYDGVLQGSLPTTASAFWDVRQDDPRGRLLVLALSDPFGYATGVFDPSELCSAEQTERRLKDLVGELIYSARRERIEIRDVLASPQQLTDFQRRLNAIPTIALKKPKLFNRLQLAPEYPESFFITDFAVEVDGDVAEQVKEAVRASGLTLRGEPLLHRPGMKDRVRALVAAHRKDEQLPPRHAVCFHVNDSADIHLLEIANDAPDFEEGALEGVGFIAGNALPGARSIVLYLASPGELRLAAERNPQHRAIHDLRTGLCWFVHPEDDGGSFYQEFPDLERGVAVNWQQHDKLALALRDQGLADCLAARFNLRIEQAPLVAGRQVNLAHVVVAKCQQAIEKLTKGFLLWHSGSFDPTKGHSPFRGALGDPPLQRLCTALNRLNPKVVQELKWLEELAPRPPDLAPEERGLPVALQRILENTEYPFWSIPSGKLVIAAEGLSIRNHGIRAIKALKTFLDALAKSDPEAFTKDIRAFLADHPISTAVTPAPEG